jgi:hypothetical protein
MIFSLKVYWIRPISLTGLVDSRLLVCYCSICILLQAKSSGNELIGGTTKLGGEFTSTQERLDINLVCLYRSPILMGRRGYFTRSNDYHLTLLRLEEGGGRGQHPVAKPLYMFLSSSRLLVRYSNSKTTF